jgi:hypothetical protein
VHAHVGVQAEPAEPVVEHGHDDDPAADAQETREQAGDQPRREQRGTEQREIRRGEMQAGDLRSSWPRE